MITAMITGRIAAQPDQRVGPSGRAYTLARVQVAQDGDTPALFVSVFAFDKQVQAVLAALGQGAEVSITGSAKLATWVDREGHAQPQLTITASAILTLHERRAIDRAVGQARHDAHQRHAQREGDRVQRLLSEAKAQWQGGGDGLDDGQPLTF